MTCARKHGVLIASLALVVSALLLSSCFPTGAEQVNPEDLMQPGAEVPDVISEEVSESLIVNADVEFDGSINWREFSANYQIVDNTVALDLLAKERTVLAKHDISSTSSSPACYYEFADKSSLIVRPGWVDFDTEYSNKAYYEHVLFPYGRTLRSDLSKVYVKTSLDGIDREGAIDTVKQIVDGLGIEVDPDPLVVALDYETLISEFESFTLKDGTQAPPWTKDQEAYAVCFEPLAHGIPYTQQRYYCGDNATFSDGAALYGVVSKEGLVRFEARGIFVATDSDTQTVKIVTPEAAIEAVGAKYADLIAGMPVEVSAIKCELVPMFENSSLEYATLKPMWVFEASQDIADPESGEIIFKNRFMLFVDAQTGVLQRFS